MSQKGWVGTTLLGCAGIGRGSQAYEFKSRELGASFASWRLCVSNFLSLCPVRGASL